MRSGAIALVPAVVAARLPLPREPRLWAHLSVAALVLNTVPFLLVGYAELHVSSAIAGVANGTAPLFTALFAFSALHDERPTARTAIGIAVGLAGAALVLRVWDGVQADPPGWAWRSPRPPDTGWAGCTCDVSSATADSTRWL